MLASIRRGLVGHELARTIRISNAGTRGENLGVNAAMVVAGVHWVLR
jgi:hypothetical protein